MSQSVPTRRILLLAAAAWLAAGAVARGDDDGHDHDRARDAVAKGEALPLSQILAILSSTQDGEVVEVELERSKSGRLFYEIKVLGANGRVRELLVDAKTGLIIKTETE